MKKTPEQRAAAFVATRKTLELATVGEDEWPTSSYAPFVKHEGSYYIYTSSLSAHTRDLLATQKASIMFIDDESNSPNVFARRRYTCRCDVTDVPRECAVWIKVMGLFEKKFGSRFPEIRSLADFTLFRLTPMHGRYVEGFGRAFHVGPNLDSSEHITPENNDKS